MNYAYQYFKIIANRVEHQITRKEQYVECHHVIPKSEGGKDTKDNLVNLTAREHYVAHLLLAKIYDDYKMWSAVIYMGAGHKGRQEFRFNSRLYQLAREEYGKKMSDALKGRIPGMLGKKHSDETRRKMSEVAKGRRHSEETKHKLSEIMKNPSEQTRRKISESLKGKPSPRKGCHLSEDQKRKISATLKGRPLSDETKAKLRGKPSPMKGKKHSEETRRKISEKLRGRKESEETRCKKSKAHRRLGTKPPSPKGKRWFNNGVEEKRANECPENFVKGRLKNGN